MPLFKGGAVARGSHHGGLPQCFEAHVARNGALRDYRRKLTPSCMTDSGSRAPISTVLFGEPKVSFGPSGKTRLQTCPESLAQQRRASGRLSTDIPDETTPSQFVGHS